MIVTATVSNVPWDAHQVAAHKVIRSCPEPVLAWLKFLSRSDSAVPCT